MDDIHAAISRLQESVTSATTRAEFRDQSAECQGDENDENKNLCVSRSALCADSALAPPAGNTTATFLQTWLDELQILFKNFSGLVPQLENTELNTADRRRLLGSGVRRYGFIEKVLEVSAEFPQIWPAFGIGKKELNESVQEIDVLRNLFVWFRFAARTVQDLLLIAGDDAFRAAGAYYTSAREGARRKDTEATQVFEMLRLFWKRPRRSNGEPTIPEVLRDTRALLRGSKDGTVSVSKECDQVIKGKKVIIDNTQRKPRGGARVVERGEVE